jgi:hypothetical protein
MNSNNDATTDFYNDLVLATAVRLIKENGYTTTLEIKNELRDRHATIDVGPITFRPNFTQNIVSDAMIVLADNSFFSWNDNGTYRSYYLNTVEFGEQEDDVSSSVNVSQYKALETINDLEKGDEITITFTKHDGAIRTIVGTVYSPNIGFGHMLVYDIELPDGNDGSNIRTVDLRKLISFEFEGTTYIVNKNIK